MKYSEAKRVLEQQDAANAVMVKYEKLVSAHKEHGFDSRAELIKALREIEKAEAGKGGSKGKARGPRGLSPDTIDQIQTLKSEGKTNAEIARTTGVSPLTVAKYVKARAGKGKTAKAAKGAPAKKKAAAGRGKGAGGPRGLSPEVIDQIKTMKGEGKTNADISRTLGVSPLTVAKYVKGQASKAAPAKKKAPAKRKAKKAKAKK